ncbi:MAG: membrane protein insertase YidC [Flavobacteriales bacterium]|nr:MAG: membrane protein insertase YidC [Flavobacteriales bacterium]
MDRNQLIGALLLGLMFVGYMYYTMPSEEERIRHQQIRDSIAQIESQKLLEAEQVTKELEQKINGDPAQANALAASEKAINDSIKAVQIASQVGVFAGAARGEEEFITIENEKIILTLSTLGGRVASVELKDYQTHDSLPLMLFDKDSSDFVLNFYESRNRLIETNRLFFEPSKKSFALEGEDVKAISMRLFAGSKDQYLEYVYTLSGNSYVVDFDVNLVRLGNVVKSNQQSMVLDWGIHAPTKEKSIENERRTTTVFYKFKNDEVDYISETTSERINLVAKTDWIAFKQQYFSACIISEEGFASGSQVESKDMEGITNDYTKYLAASLELPFSNADAASIHLKFYFGPNHYQTLSELNIGLEEQIDLGWGLFGWVNEWMVIPVFNFLEGFDLGYGMIIFLLTLFIKLILFPITYKTYKSSAKMRVLKPEVDALNEKFKDAEPMKKQQATMTLYRQAGVNPMAGCVPMLIQMPILYAMFRFFPASIELRQEGFLWADDLSSYDSVYDLGFSIPFYGDHVSLFTLFMAASTFLYSKYNMQMTMSSGPQAQQMKIMMYFMPVMLLGFFNSYSSGLSYYYFLANIISVIQQLVIKKWFIDEDAIHRKIEENKKKPPKKKSKFQNRLEDMAKQRGYQSPKAKKKR